jgi:hypothetical protein
MSREQLEAVALELGIKAGKKMDDENLSYTILDAQAMAESLKPDEKPKPKRGRPRKDASAAAETATADSSESTAVTAVSKPKRGRPRKNAPADNQPSTQNVDGQSVRASKPRKNQDKSDVEPESGSLFESSEKSQENKRDLSKRSGKNKKQEAVPVVASSDQQTSSSSPSNQVAAEKDALQSADGGRRRNRKGNNGQAVQGNDASMSSAPVKNAGQETETNDKPQGTVNGKEFIHQLFDDLKDDPAAQRPNNNGFRNRNNQNNQNNNNNQRKKGPEIEFEGTVEATGVLRSCLMALDSFAPPTTTT